MQQRSLLRRALLSAPLAILAIPTTASAIRPTNGRPTFELATGASAAIPSLVRWGAPSHVTKARGARITSGIAKLEAEAGGRVWASFRESTGVPSRIFVPGLHAPSVTNDATAAEAFARAFLARHVDLLAPGSSASDFVLVSNDLDAGMRTLGFEQWHRGLRVRGGQLSFRFKNDRLVLVGSEAFPFDEPSVDVDPNVAPTDPAAIDASALAFAARRSTLASLVAAPSSAPFILPTFDGSLAYRIVVARRTVARPTATTPASDLEVFVDAASGNAIASEERLRFSTGHFALHVPVRSPSYGPRFDAPGASANLNVDGSGALSSATGAIDFAGGSGHVLAFSAGPNVDVQSQNLPETSVTFDLPDAGFFAWDVSGDELADAQLSGFVHGFEVREYAKNFAPTLPFLDQQVKVVMNIVDTCNAYSDGTTIHFYQSGSGCENSGRIADVIYHEYGHSIHAHAIIPGVGVFDGALSEGVSDYLAATITGDPAMGRGFFFDAQPLRDLDPSNHEAHWPEDLFGEEHEDGKIIAQTLWDLRKALVAKLGAAEGVAHTDALYYQGIRRAADIPSMYAEVLAADDDDGDVENGTPNACEINHAFGLHGLRATPLASSPLTLVPAEMDGYVITAELQGIFTQCPEDQLVHADVHWTNERDASQTGDVAMTATGSTLTATLPKQKVGSTIDYSVAATFGDGVVLGLPDNLADRAYQFYVGPVVNLYCTTFETDPATEGWTHGLTQGMMQSGADDWEWGRPKGTPANGDPTEAFSGKKAYGNDLGDLPEHNGLYQPDKTNWALSPVVDVTGYDIVRLQYRRWLNVEDGHFDHASIYANDQLAWHNFDSDQGDSSTTDHRDREWRFHDVDLTPYLADGKVQIKYELESDPGKELGGWTIDDFCIVGVTSPPPDPCADGVGGGCGASSTGTAGFDAATPQGGCGCSVPAGDTGRAWALAGLVAACASFARRRARRG